MEHVFVTYRIRSREAYERWSRERDQVVVPAAPGIEGFEVYLVEGDGEPPYDVVEVITVESWDAFQRALETDDMKQLGREFGDVADPASVTTLRARRL